MNKIKEKLFGYYNIVQGEVSDLNVLLKKGMMEKIKEKFFGYDSGSVDV